MDKTSNKLKHDDKMRKKKLFIAGQKAIFWWISGSSGKHLREDMANIDWEK